MNLCRCRLGRRRRAPAYARLLPLAGIALLAGVAGRPFYDLWHVLGDVVAVAVFAVLWAALVVHARAHPRHDAVRVSATATVRRG